MYLIMYCLKIFYSATVLKTEAGSLPEGKVKVKLEHDGTILDVDEDDVEKVRGLGDIAKIIITIIVSISILIAIYNLILLKSEETSVFIS